MELEGELDQYRAALAEMAAEMAQLRTELVDQGGLAARLAGLLPEAATAGALVPVRDGRTSSPGDHQQQPPGAPPAARESTPASASRGEDLQAAGTAGDPPAGSR